MRYLAYCSYRGTDYAGFQKQQSKPTVQGKIEEVLSFVLGKKTVIHASGRTDAKVHALSQPFTFDSHEIEDLDKFVYALNRLLPLDISILTVNPTSDDFDARRMAISKTYEYKFYVFRRNPLATDIIAHLCRDDFAPEKFLKALKVYEGSHDFFNFTTKETDEKQFIRTVFSIKGDYDPKEDLVTVRIEGDGFMRYQVRFMIGGAILVGLGKLSVEDLDNYLHPEEIKKTIPYKAAPEGLYLVEVKYDRKTHL